MENYTRHEHDEFCKRMEDEHARINHRVKSLEDAVREIGALTASVQKLATNMENMLKTMDAQGKKIEELEARDGEMWRKVVGYAITAVIGVVVGYIFTLIGM